MKKLFPFFALVNALIFTLPAQAEDASPLAEAVIYVDHGCADDDKLDQCLRVDWVKDQTFTWQWYEGENSKGDIVASVDRNEILETLGEIFDNDDFDARKLSAALKNKKDIQQWFQDLLTADRAELPSLLALDGNTVEIKADPACADKSVYSCPSRRIEFNLIGAASENATAPAVSSAASADAADTTGLDNSANSSPGSAGWWIFGALLFFLTAGMAALGLLVRKLLKQSDRQQSMLNDLSSFTLDNLGNISRVLDADESKQSADISARLKGGRKNLLTDADRLAPVFSDILAPIVRDAPTARLYLSLQDKLFHATQDEETRASITNEARQRLSSFIPEAENASTLGDMMAVLERYEQQQKKQQAEAEAGLRKAVDQLLKDQDDLTRQTQIAFTNLQQTIGRLDSVVKTNAEKHLFELTRAMPEKLGVLKTNLDDLTVRTEQDKQALENTMLQSLQQFEEKMTDNFTVVAERVESIFRNAGSAHTIADAAKNLKAYRIIEASNEAPAKLAELESSSAVTMMSGAANWMKQIGEGYHSLHEPVAQGDSISRYCAYVLDSAGLKTTLADFDASFFDRLGIAASQGDTEEFLRLWGNAKDRAVHSDLFKIQFLLENMLCPLLQEQQEHPVLSIRDQIVPFCESIAGSARMVGIQLHRVAPQTDQNICRWFMDPCGDSGKMTQAVLNSKIEFVEIFKEWLQNVNNCNPESSSNMAIEICQLGYTFTGKSRPEKMTRVVCYKDVAWQLN